MSLKRCQIYFLKFLQKISLTPFYVNHPLQIIAHSQGTLTMSNASLYYGLPQGSTFVFKSPALNFFSANQAASVNGGTLQFVQPFGVGANLWASSFNPIKFGSGVLDLLCGFCTHVNNGLQ